MNRIAILVTAIVAANVGAIDLAAPLEAAEVRAVITTEAKRTPAPGFTLEDSSGKRVTLKDYRGKVVLLNFWATWCGGCKQEMPWFQEFEKTLGPRRFAVLGLSVDEDGWNVVRPFMANADVIYRMALAAKTTPNDYAVKSLPATFLIDRKGRIAATYIGLVDRADLEANIKALLNLRPR